MADALGQVNSQIPISDLDEKTLTDINIEDMMIIEDSESTKKISFSNIREHISNYITNSRSIVFEDGETDEENINSGDTFDRMLSKIKYFINKITNHIANKENPHGLTKQQIGLGQVDNTADIDKPISAIQRQEFDKKINTSEATEMIKSSIANIDLDTLGAVKKEDFKAFYKSTYTGKAVIPNYQDECYLKISDLTDIVLDKNLLSVKLPNANSEEYIMTPEYILNITLEDNILKIYPNKIFIDNFLDSYAMDTIEPSDHLLSPTKSDLSYPLEIDITLSYYVASGDDIRVKLDNLTTNIEKLNSLIPLLEIGLTADTIFPKLEENTDPDTCERTGVWRYCNDSRVDEYLQLNFPSRALQIKITQKENIAIRLNIGDLTQASAWRDWITIA